MNSRERIMLTLRHKEGDRIPLSFGAGKACRFTRGFYVKLIKYLGIDEAVKEGPPLSLALASDAVLEKLGVDIREAKPQVIYAGTGKAKSWEDKDNYYARDDWGAVSRMPKKYGLCYDMIEFPLAGAGEDADSGYVWPSPGKIRPESRKTAEKYRADGYPVMFVDAFGFSFIQQGTHVYGYENWMMMLASEESRVRRFQEILLEKKMAWWDNVIDVYGDTVDIITETDDMGTQTGPFISLQMFRSLSLPYLKRLFEHIKKITDAKLLFHSCGSVSAFYRDLIDIGLDIINPVQISAADMDPYYLKKEFGKDLVFWGGGVDTQYALPFGSKREVAESVKRNIDAFGKDGGFVFAPVHNVQADVPIENFITMMETYMAHCNYH